MPLPERAARGLVVGKFCPLHRGHQVLLDHAQAACERLVVVSYTRPEFDGLWPARREQWLRNLYPQAQHWVLDDARLAALCQQRGVPVRALPHNDEDDATHRHFVAWLLREIVRSDVDAVFTSEAYGPGFAAVLSQEQQQRGGRAVVHVEVDPARVRVPTSGTAIRRSESRETRASWTASAASSRSPSVRRATAQRRSR